MAEKNNESENLSRIKDILFGEDLQSIDEQFKAFKDERSTAFEQLKQQLDERFKKIEDLLSRKSSEVEKVQEESIEVQKTINQDFKKEMSKVTLDVLKEKVRIEKIINNNDDVFSEKITLMRKELESMIEKAIKDTNVKHNELKDNKIDKNTIADLFLVLSKELKK